MAGFKNFIPPKALVWREGKKKEVAARDLVPGDIVEVNLGDNIPADLVIIKSNEMKVNNASLTGESEELLRVPEESTLGTFSKVPMLLSSVLLAQMAQGPVSFSKQVTRQLLDR